MNRNHIIIEENREIVGELLYKAMYEYKGGRWELNETKDVWYVIADRFIELVHQASENDK